MFGHEGDYRPAEKLIRVTSPTMILIWGAVIIVTGVIFVVVALTSHMEGHRRRHRNLRLIRTSAVAAGAATMTVGGGIVVLGCRRRRQLVREGQTAEAVVTGRWQQWRWTKFHQYYMAYKFIAQLPDGTTSVVGCRMADATLYHQLRIGSTFLVRYVPSNLRIGAPVWRRVARSGRR